MSCKEPKPTDSTKKGKAKHQKKSPAQLKRESPASQSWTDEHGGRVSYRKSNGRWSKVYRPPKHRRVVEAITDHQKLGLKTHFEVKWEGLHKKERIPYDSQELEKSDVLKKYIL